MNVWILSTKLKINTNLSSIGLKINIKNYLIVLLKIKRRWSKYKSKWLCNGYNNHIIIK